MTLILRKCQKNGYSRNNFYYGQVGEIVTAPDWKTTPICGNGLHGLKEGNGDWELLDGYHWLIIEANDDDIIDIDKNKCKFRTGKILFRGTTKQLSESEFPNILKINNYSAYEWARYIGNHDVMIHKINDSVSAFFWAQYIGNHDVMINNITQSYWAYLWARNIGDHDVMIHKITDSQSAYYWAKYVGKNQNEMKIRVTDIDYINLWNLSFPNNKIEKV